MLGKRGSIRVTNFEILGGGGGGSEKKQGGNDWGEMSGTGIFDGGKGGPVAREVLYVNEHLTS